MIQGISHAYFPFGIVVDGNIKYDKRTKHNRPHIQSIYNGPMALNKSSRIREIVTFYTDILATHVIGLLGSELAAGGCYDAVIIPPQMRLKQVLTNIIFCVIA